MTIIRRFLLPLAAGVALCSAAGARAQTNEELNAKLKQLQAEIDALKAAQAKAPAAKPAEAKPEASAAERLDLLEVKQSDAVVKGDIPGSFRIPGTEMSLRLYGYAETNWVHAFNNDNSDNDYSTFAPYLPLKGSTQAKSGGRDYLTARESRFGMEGGMPTKHGVLGIKIEGDFNNDPHSGDSTLYGARANISSQHISNSYGFRLRHAYGQFAGLLVGQTWSTFMDADNFPETVDYNGPVGATFLRQPQIRYAYATPKSGTFTVALENSVTYVDDNTGASINASASRIPDMVARWDRSFEAGALSLRAMTQEFRLKNADISAKKRGYGVAASGTIKTRGPDYLTWGVTYGNGIGRYLNYIEGAAYDATKNEIVFEKAIGGYVGYQIKPSDWLRFNFAYGFTYDFDSDYTKFAKANPPLDGSGPDLDAARFGTNRWVQQGHAGFFVTPVAATDFGLEAIYGARRTLGGLKGDEFRMNFLARYYINY